MRAEPVAEFIRRHRVHYDVMPDVVVLPTGRTPVGYEVRLFAVHDRWARALPGCAKCDPLVRGLESVACAILPEKDRPTLATVLPFHPLLYDSREVPGADEVSIAVRLAHRDAYVKPVDACEERCLKEMRQRLKALGVPER